VWMNLEKIANLKYVVRSGWVIRGVPNSVAETVAAHTFEVMLISMYLADGLRRGCADVDVEKVMKMSLLHDVPEVMVGDVVKLVKARAPELFTKIELEVAQQLNLSSYVDLLDDLSKGLTLEARIVKLSDVLATYLQGIRYLKTGYEDVEEIVLNSKTTIEEMINSWLPEGCKPLLKNMLSNIDVTL
jgi:putative hydrolase of HD superfamily